MTKWTFIITLTLFTCIDSYGQHCPYDPISIIVLDITYNDTVVDSLRVILTGKNYRNRSDPCFGARNKHFEKLNAQGELNKDYFPFAKDKYIVYLGNSSSFACWYQIVITDTDGEKNGGDFGQTIVPIDPKDFYSLCVDAWDLIKPMTVELNKK